MQERDIKPLCERMVLLWQECIKNKKWHLVYPFTRLMYELGVHLERDDNLSTLLPYFKEEFRNHLDELVEACIKINSLGREETLRHLLFNFFQGKLIRKWEINLGQQNGIQLQVLNESYPYNLKHWNEVSKSHSEDKDNVAHLFGPVEHGGYAYGAKLEDAINHSHDNPTRVGDLLLTSLPVLSRRLAVADSNQMPKIDFFMSDRLIYWYIKNKTELSNKDWEWCQFLRFYQATYLYQRQVIKPFLTQEQDEAKKILEKTYEENSFSVLKLQKITLLLRRFNRDFEKTCLLSKDSFDKLLDQVTKIISFSIDSLPESYQCQLEQLKRSRGSFKSEISIFAQQKQNTEDVKKLLNLFLENSILLLGAPPCSLGFMLLGSTSRQDRLPHSDVELALLYEPVKNNASETEHYIAGLIALLEMQVIHLGETIPDKEGFYLDTTTSVRSHEYLRGSPEDIVKKGLQLKEINTPEMLVPVDNPRDLKVHPFLFDPSLYSLIQPTLLNEAYGGKELFQSYMKKLSTYLDADPGIKNPSLLLELADLVYPTLIDEKIDTQGKLGTEKQDILKLEKRPLALTLISKTKLTNRRMIALWVWWNVLRCAEDFQKGPIVNLKNAFHKPLAYLGLGLRLYYDLKADCLENIFEEAIKKNILSEELGRFYINMIAWITQLRAGLHLVAGYQTDKLEISKLSPAEIYRYKYLISFIKLMQGTVEYYLNFKDFQAENYALPKFKLDKLIDNYFRHRLSLVKKAEDYVQWFTHITQFLLYTHAPLHRHRYYYRLLPKKYRLSSMNATKIWIKSTKDNYWKQENDFWEILWDAPLSHGARPSHVVREEKWKESLTNLLTTEDKISEEKTKVYVKSLQLEKTSVVLPKIVEAFLKGQWISVHGKFVKKSEHPIAKRMLGNHLVIPWPLPEDIDKLLRATDEEIDQGLKRIYENAKFYFKIFPEYPLVELFVNDLSRRLGYYHPRNVDVWRWQSGRFDYPILVSEAVPGKSLQEILENNSEFSLDGFAFSQMMVVNSLFSFEDNKPDNIQLYKDEFGRSRLVLIDADRWFAPIFKQNKLNVKNLIFCLSKQMSSEVDSLFQEEFLSLNPRDVLQCWIAYMEGLAKLCMESFESKIEDYFHRTKLKEEKSLLLPPIKWHTVYKLFDQMQEIRELFLIETKVSRSAHWMLLGKIYPRLANYHLSIPKEFTPLEQFKYVAGYAYLKPKGDNKVDHFPSRIDFITQTQDIWERLPALGKIEENWKRDIENARQQLEGLTESFEIILKAEAELQNGDIQLFEKLSQRGKEKLLSKLDWSTLKDKKAEMSLIRAQKIKTNFLTLTFHSAQFLTTDDLATLIENSPSLQSLRLENCPLVDQSFLRALPKQDAALRELFINKLPKFESLDSATSLIFGERSLVLPNLVSLSIIDCMGSLEINIYAPLLSSAKLLTKNLKVLKTGSQNLETLEIHSLALLPLKQWRDVMDMKHVFKLNRLLWVCDTKDQEVQLFAKILQKLPILLDANWDPSIRELRLPFVKRLDSVTEQEVNYSLVKQDERKKLLEDVLQLQREFDSQFSQFGRMKILQERLKTGDMQERIYAAGILHSLGQTSPEIIKTVRQGLKDDNPVVQMDAVELLGRLENINSEIIQNLLKLLKESKKQGVRVRIIETLCQFKKTNSKAITDSKQIIETLMQVLWSDSWVGATAAEALGKLEKVDYLIVESLIQALERDDSRIGVAAAKALGALGKLEVASPNLPKITEALILASRRPKNMVAAAEALGNLRASSQIINALVNVLIKDDFKAQKSAAKALGKLGDTSSDVIEALTEVMGEAVVPISMQQILAARELVNLLKQSSMTLDRILQDAFGILIQALESDISDVQYLATKTLAMSGNASLKVIRVLTNKFGTSIISSVPEALIQLGKHCSDVDNELLQALNTSEPYKRKQAAETFGLIGRKNQDVISHLTTRALADLDSYVRISAAKALIQLEIPESDNLPIIDMLIKEVTKKDNKMRFPSVAPVLATEVLGMLVNSKFNSEVIVSLLNALRIKDKNFSDTSELEDSEGFSYRFVMIRETAAEALNQLMKASPEVIKSLEELLTDLDTHIQVLAGGLLVKLGGLNSLVIDTLISALKDKRNRVQDMAAILLVKLGKIFKKNLDNLFIEFGRKYVSYFPQVGQSQHTKEISKSSYNPTLFKATSEAGKKESAQKIQIEFTDAFVNKSQTPKQFAIENGFALRTTDGDGNCFFSSIAILLNHQRGTSLTHTDVRREAINYIRTHSEIFQEIFANNFDYGTQEEYLNKMARDKTWAVGPIIDATALHYGFRLTIVDFREHEEIHFVRLNEEDQTLPLLTLCRTGENQQCQHYDALLSLPLSKQNTFRSTVFMFESDESYSGSNSLAMNMH